MGCSGPCVTCGNYLSGCLVAHDEDFYYTASKEELMRRLNWNVFLNKNDRNMIQKEIDLYEVEEKYAKKEDAKVPQMFKMQSNGDCCIDKRPAKRIRFMLDGCDISFVAEAPEDITLKQLLKQCDKIKPDWCACGIRSLTEESEPEIIIDYDNIRKINEYVSCTIKEGD
jgi:hypothetical protein